MYRDLPPARRLLYRATDPFLLASARVLAPVPWAADVRRTEVGARPRISIVTPSFNQALFLERTMNSVLGQRDVAFEYVVQDGGSTDGTLSILERRSGELTAWESRPDAGQSAAINAGFRRTTGEIMAYLNSDDMLVPGALALVAGFMRARPDVDVVYSHGVMIDESDRPIALMLLPEHSPRALRLYDYVPQMTVFWRRAIWERVGGSLDESLHYAMDWDLLLRYADAGARFARLPTLLAAFRLHNAQKTRTIRAQGSREGDALRQRNAKRLVPFPELVVRSLPHLLRRAWLVARYRAGLERIEVPWTRAPRGFS
jgi:glycosyltransferase involved in cell wall biosynthesis